LRIAPLARCIIMAVISMTATIGSAASADAFRDHLRALLTEPQTAFPALHGERTSDVWPRWTAKSFIPNAACEIIGADDGPDAELRCVINDKSPAEETQAYFAATRAAIESCVASLPNGRKFERGESRKNADGFQGSSTSWTYRSKTERFEIELTDDRVFGSARNSFSVRYQKV